MKNNYFVEMLQVLFIGLKLTEHVDWSWLWVLSPSWIMVLVAGVLFATGNTDKRRNRR